MTNYDAVIYEVIETIRADKSITQPWRNYAIKHFQEGLASARMGKTTTNVARPESSLVGKTTNDTFSSPNEALLASTQATDPQNAVCSCPAGGMRRDCPIHGRLS